MKVEGAKAQISKGLCERRKPAQGGFNEKQRVFAGEPGKASADLTRIPKLGRSRGGAFENYGDWQGVGKATPDKICTRWWPARHARSDAPARLSGAGRTVGNGLRRQTERLTRSVRRVAGRYGPVARATLVCNRSLMPDFSRSPLMLS